jgi:hypothetical protein
MSRRRKNRKLSSLKSAVRAAERRKTCQPSWPALAAGAAFASSQIGPPLGYRLETNLPAQAYSGLFYVTDSRCNRLNVEGVITDAEFKQKLLEERAVYQRILNPTTQ